MFSLMLVTEKKLIVVLVTCEYCLHSVSQPSSAHRHHVTARYITKLSAWRLKSFPQKKEKEINKRLKIQI